jgi:hypothetical protein
MLRIVAEAANEAHHHGVPLDELTPIWRVLEPTTPAARKLTFDPTGLLRQRVREANGS